jgi:hypothetical protein
VFVTDLPHGPGDRWKGFPSKDGESPTGLPSEGEILVGYFINELDGKHHSCGPYVPSIIGVACGVRGSNL